VFCILSSSLYLLLTVQYHPDHL